MTLTLREQFALQAPKEPWASFKPVGLPEEVPAIKPYPNDSTWGDRRYEWEQLRSALIALQWPWYYADEMVKAGSVNSGHSSLQACGSSAGSDGGSPADFDCELVGVFPTMEEAMAARDKAKTSQ